MALRSLHDLLPSAARRAGITRDLAITAALRAGGEALAKIFGSGYARFVDVTAVTKTGELVLTCRSPAVAQTIRIHERAVIAAVTTAAPSLQVTRCFLVPRSRGDVRSAVLPGSDCSDDGESVP